MCWSTYVLIVMAAAAVAAGLFAWWYKTKQYKYTHGAASAVLPPDYREILNNYTDQVDVIKAFPQSRTPSLIDRTILMKKAKYVTDRIGGETVKLWVPRSFPDLPQRTMA